MTRDKSCYQTFHFHPITSHQTAGLLFPINAGYRQCGRGAHGERRETASQICQAGLLRLCWLRLQTSRLYSAHNVAS